MVEVGNSDNVMMHKSVFWSATVTASPFTISYALPALFCFADKRFCELRGLRLMADRLSDFASAQGALIYWINAATTPDWLKQSGEEYKHTHARE